MNALHSHVQGRGTPPDSFLDELTAWGRSAPDEIFAPNDEPGDVFNDLAPLLGPWDGSAVKRKAAMLELLRVLAGFESSWKWAEGVDTTNRTSMANVEGQETGIFQVSHDSLALDRADSALRDCVERFCGSTDVLAFIGTMKTNHAFALEYAARLLRYSYKWDGPIKRHELDSSLSREAMAEFEALLA